MTDVWFDSGGTRCFGVHLRGSGDAFAGEDGRRPCVVLGHGFAGTVDSGLLPFAERFAEAGLDALAFDYRGFGRSEGSPRQVLSIPRQHEDWAAAVRFARETDGIDPDRIVLWGSSYAGGHVVPVAVADGRVVAVISQAPHMDGFVTMANALRQNGLAATNRVTAVALRDAIGALLRRPPVLVPVVAAPGTIGVMTTPDAEPGMTSIAGPSWRNEVAARALLDVGPYRPGRLTDQLHCPILIQICDRDLVTPPKPAQDAAWRATGRAEVRTYPIGHFDIYTGAWFEKAVGDQLHFLRRHTGVSARAREAVGAA